jgi:hypothetical protein
MNAVEIEQADAGLPRWADTFPYVNGALFSGGNEAPRFSRIARSYLLHVGGLDWTKINPDIFGSMQKLALAEFLPLRNENWITCGNALRLDWLSICPPTGTGVKLLADDLFSTPLTQTEIDFENEGGETYVCGNPPYLGYNNPPNKKTNWNGSLAIRHLTGGHWTTSLAGLVNMQNLPTTGLKLHSWLPIRSAKASIHRRPLRSRQNARRPARGA